VSGEIFLFDWFCRTSNYRNTTDNFELEKPEVPIDVSNTPFSKLSDSMHMIDRKFLVQSRVHMIGMTGVSI
jgi:hypothetical protein